MCSSGVVKQNKLYFTLLNEPLGYVLLIKLSMILIQVHIKDPII